MNQELFNAIADTKGIPLEGELQTIVALVHMHYPDEKLQDEITYYREALVKIRMNVIEPNSSRLANRALNHYQKTPL